MLHTGDGRQVAVVKMWTKPSFERLVAHAAQYGIEVAQFDEAEKGFGRKGGYRLEYLNGWMPPTEKKNLCVKNLCVKSPKRSRRHGYG